MAPKNRDWSKLLNKGMQRKYRKAMDTIVKCKVNTHSVPQVLYDAALKDFCWFQQGLTTWLIFQIIKDIGEKHCVSV